MKTKPSAENYRADRCEWGFRNPRNHLSNSQFKKLILAMLERGDQRIICPGCKRDMYLELKISAHGHMRPLTPAQKKSVEDWKEQYATEEEDE